MLVATPVVQSLHIYPVKSCRGIDLTVSELNQWGLQWDREWMFADMQGQMLTQRTHAALSRVSTKIGREALELSAIGHPTLYVPYAQMGDKRSVQVWESSCVGIDQGDDASQWIAAVSGLEARLLRFDPQHHRAVDVSEISRQVAPARTAFADVYPLLIISQASLDDLNTRLAEPVPMHRFRPNIVLADCDPYAEDSWENVRIGSTPCEIVKPCVRCNFPTVNQDTGISSSEPLRTIAAYRQDVSFGMNAIHRSQSKISVGDLLTFIEH